MRDTARLAQMRSIAVLCMLRDPPRACDPSPTHRQVPAVGPNPPKNTDAR
jgi:hypothetical protein